RLVHHPVWSLVETPRIAEEGRAPRGLAVESIGLSRAPGTTAPAAASVGARAIAQPTARCLGGSGIADALVAVDHIVLGCPDVVGETIRPRNRQAPTVIDLAEAIQAARRLPAGVGGALLVVDGGRTMLP